MTIYELLYGAGPTKQDLPHWAVLPAEIILGCIAYEFNWTMLPIMVCTGHWVFLQGASVQAWSRAVW